MSITLSILVLVSVVAAFFLIVYSDSIPDIFKSHVEKLNRTVIISIVILLLLIIAVTSIWISNEGSRQESDVPNGANKNGNENLVDPSLRPRLDTNNSLHDTLIGITDSGQEGVPVEIVKQRVIVDSTIARLKISSFTPSEITVLAGDSLSISSNGKILIGPNFKYSSPYGIEKSFSYLWLLQNDVRLGALMLKIGEGKQSGNWSYCGLDYANITDANGKIFFEVNDSYQLDNKGSYKVIVKRYRFGLR